MDFWIRLLRFLSVFYSRRLDWFFNDFLFDLILGLLLLAFVCEPPEPSSLRPLLLLGPFIFADTTLISALCQTFGLIHNPGSTDIHFFRLIRRKRFPCWRLYNIFWMKFYRSLCLNSFLFGRRQRRRYGDSWRLVSYRWVSLLSLAAFRYCIPQIQCNLFDSIPLPLLGRIDHVV